MKKLYFPLFVLLLNFNLSAQTYFQEDFEGDTLVTNNAWTTQVITASPSGFDWILDEFGGNQYVEMNNYNGTGNEIVETWLFSPPIDLSNSDMPLLNFDNLKRFTGQDLEVLASIDYDPNNLPTQSNWTDISSLCNLDADVDSWDYGNTGDVDISIFKSATFTLAFRYQGGDSGGSISQLDNITITEGGTVSVTESGQAIFNIYPNPTSDLLQIEIEGEHEMNLYDVLGQLIKVYPIDGNTIISLKDYNTGIYLAQIGNSTKRISVK